MNEKTFSIGDSLSYGWEKFKKNPWLLIGATLIFAIITWIESNLIPLIIAVVSSSGRNPSIVAIFIVASLINTIVSIGVTKFLLAIVNGQKLSLRIIYTSYSPFIKIFILNLLLLLVVGLPLTFGASLVIAGLASLSLFHPLILLGIVLVFVTIYIYSQLMFIVMLSIDRNLGIIQTLIACRKITSGFGTRVHLLGFVTILIVFNCFGMMLFFIGQIITLPISAIAFTHAYRRLLSQTPIGNSSRINK